MPTVQLLHNPGAGDEEHSKKKLVKAIESRGYACRYSSTKEKGWEKLEDDVDFIVLAGGDGTVRKVTRKLLERTLLQKRFSIGLLPLGTANNVATTLGLQKQNTDELIESWQTAEKKNFDIGIVKGLADPAFFLEGYGYGLFPFLMQEMKTLEEKEGETPDEKIKRALRVLHGLVQSYEAKECRMEIDGTDYTDKFLLVEVMNTCSLGPNLHLAPNADPGDGYLNVVVITENQRADFSQYVLDRVHGHSVPFSYQTHKAQKVSLQWEGKMAHADDELIKIRKSTQVEVEIRAGVLEFLVP